MKRFYRGMSLFFAIALMLSLLSIPTAALPSGSQDYIVVGGSGTFSVYQAASGTTDYSQYSKISDFSTMTLALNYIGNLVQDGSTTITFGETFSSADGPSGWCDVGSDVAAVNGGGMSFSIGSSGTYTVKGKLTGSGDYVLSFQMYLIGIIDGAEIQSTSTSANSCAVASIMSDVTVKPGSVITASTGSALHMFDAGAAYIEGGTLTGGTSESAIYDESIHALNISGGTVSSDSTYAVYNSGTGAVNISGGAVRSSASNTIYNNSTGKITISDQADISTSSRYAAVWLHGGTSGETILEMTGGTVSNTNASSFQLTDANVPTAIGNGSVGTVLISGGSIQSTGFGVGSSSSAVLKISGGTINVGENGFGVANGSTGGVYLSGSPTITGGRANLVEARSGSIHASDGATADYSGDPLSVFYFGPITSRTTVAIADVTAGTNDAKFTSANTDPYYALELTGTNLYFVTHTAVNTDTNTYYDDVQTALDAATDGQTVKLICDVNTSNQIEFDKSGVSVTLDLNGRTLIRSGNVTDSGTSSEAVLYAAAGTLTIEDTSADMDGSIKFVSTGGNGGTGLHVGASGTVDLLSGGIFGCGQAITSTTGAHLTISGGVVCGYADVVNSEAINIAAGTYLTITGGYIGTRHSGAAMILTPSAPASGDWTLSGGYFTSPNYTSSGSVHSLADFAANYTVTTLSTPVADAITGGLTYSYVLTTPRTISFDASTNGGSSVSSSMTTADSGRLNTLPLATKTGKIFDGWYTAPTGGTKITTDFVFLANSTVYAQYVDGFTFKYYTSDGNELLTTNAVSFSEEKWLSNYAPAQTGKDFIGWATEPNSTTLAYLPGSDYTGVYNAASSPKPESLSLYAIWEDAPTRNYSTNSIYSGGGSYNGPADETVSTSFTIGGDVNQIDPPRVRADLIVDGYDVDPSEEDHIYLVDETWNVEYSLGIMTGANNTWNSTLFSIPQYDLVSGHTYHIRLTVPGGFSFGIRGVYLLVDSGSDAGNLDGSSTALAYSTGTLAAATTIKSSEASSYSLEYKLSSLNEHGTAAQLAYATSSVTTTAGGTVADPQSMGVTLAPDTKYQLDIIIKNGLVPVAIISRTFYCYTYGYDMNGAVGTEPNSGYVISGEKLTAPTAPTSSGKVFSGWYTDSGCTKQWNFATDTAAANLKLYAKWTNPSYSSDTRTISVSSITSSVFDRMHMNLFSAEADMQSAFSNSVEVRVTDSTAGSAAVLSLIGSGGTAYPFDISLYIKNTDTKTEPASGYTVTITMPLPESLWASRDSIRLVHDSDGTLTTLPYTLKQSGNVWCITFKADSFSPYALVIGMKKGLQASTTSGLPYYLGSDGGKVFIGFAAKFDGATRYLETTGKKIFFAANPKNFSDLSGCWAKDNIGFVTEREIFLGTSENRFDPNSGMTRAMFATVLGRLYERSYGAVLTGSKGTFSDVTDTAWYGKYVNWAYENGIITGVSSDQFQPNANITRQEMAAMLYRFAKYLDVLPADGSTVALAYSDASVISDWAVNAALYCQTTGIITGRDGGAFAPKGTATRAEVAVILGRFINHVLN